MYSIGWFSSGRGAGSRQLLTTMHSYIQQGEIEAGISFVFCNRERGFSAETDRFLDLVESYGIPLICLSSRRFREALPPERLSGWRTEYDREVMRRLEGYAVDLGVLAGYMLIVSPEMCRRYNLINLHPAEPGGPKGTWREVIWELIEQGAERSGVMMHMVTPELDEGPPVTYCRFSIRGAPFDEHWERLKRESAAVIRAKEGDDFALFKLIRQHGLKRELPLVVTTVKAFSEARVGIRQGQIIDAAGMPIDGYDLSAEIDRLIG